MTMRDDRTIIDENWDMWVKGELCDYIFVSTDEWYKNNLGDKIWWKCPNKVLAVVFSFDKKKKFHFPEDYPDKLTQEQLKLFNKENPFLAKLYM